jgi:hypothetical protein
MLSGMHKIHRAQLDVAQLKIEEEDSGEKKDEAGRFGG